MKHLTVVKKDVNPMILNLSIDVANERDLGPIQMRRGILQRRAFKEERASSNLPHLQLGKGDGVPKIDMSKLYKICFQFG